MWNPTGPRGGGGTGGTGSRSTRGGSGYQYGGAQGTYAYKPVDPRAPWTGAGGTGDVSTRGGSGNPYDRGYVPPGPGGPGLDSNDPGGGVGPGDTGPTDYRPGGGGTTTTGGGHHSATGGGGTTVTSRDPAGPGGTPLLPGAGAAWYAANQAKVDAARARYGALPQDQKAGFRTDEKGARYWYEPGVSAENANLAVNKDWAYNMAQPTGMYGVRQLAGQGPAPVRAYLPPPAPVVTPGVSGPPGSVVETPSTHIPNQQPVYGGGPVGTGTGGGPVAPFTPLGQSGLTAQQPTAGQPSAPTKAAQYGMIGGGPQPTGSQPAGFAPANAPGSMQANQQGAYYGSRTNRMTQQQGIAAHNKYDPNAAVRPSQFTTFMPSDYRNNQARYGGM